MFHRIVAPGLELRQFQLADAEEIYAAADRNRAYLREWLPWVDKTHSPDDIRDFIAGRLEQFEANDGPTAAVRLNGRIVGSVGVHPIDWLNRACHLGYWLDPAEQGRGIITRSVASILDYLFGEIELHRVTIQCATGNEKSCAIPERLGFVREGTIRESQWINDRWVDLVVWGMLAQDWEIPHS